MSGSPPRDEDEQLRWDQRRGPGLRPDGRRPCRAPLPAGNALPSRPAWSEAAETGAPRDLACAARGAPGSGSGKPDPCSGPGVQGRKAGAPPRTSVSAVGGGRGLILKRNQTPGQPRGPRGWRGGRKGFAHPPHKFREGSAPRCPGTHERRPAPVACAGRGSEPGAPRLAPASPFPRSAVGRACSGHVSPRPQPQR